MSSNAETKNRGHEKSLNQAGSTQLRMVKEKELTLELNLELMQLGENINLRKLYDDMNVNLNNLTTVQRLSTKILKNFVKLKKNSENFQNKFVKDVGSVSHYL